MFNCIHTHGSCARLFLDYGYSIDAALLEIRHVNPLSKPFGLTSSPVQGKTGQGTGKDKAQENKTRQDIKNLRQGKTIQDMTNTTYQDKTRQDKIDTTRQDKTGLENTG